jgi:hypothetical protein
MGTARYAVADAGNHRRLNHEVQIDTSVPIFKPKSTPDVDSGGADVHRLLARDRYLNLSFLIAEP